MFAPLLLGQAIAMNRGEEYHAQITRLSADIDVGDEENVDNGADTTATNVIVASYTNYLCRPDITSFSNVCYYDYIRDWEAVALKQRTTARPVTPFTDDHPLA